MLVVVVVVLVVVVGGVVCCGSCRGWIRCGRCGSFGCWICCCAGSCSSWLSCCFVVVVVVG